MTLCPIRSADYKCVLQVPVYKPVFPNLVRVLKFMKTGVIYDICKHVNELVDAISPYVTLC